MKKAYIYLLILMTVISVMPSCSTDSPQDLCGLIGNWRLRAIDFDDCESPWSAISAFEVECLPVADGLICTESGWYFQGDGNLSIELIAVFTFDNDREEVTNRLDWSYQLLGGQELNICFDATCIPVTCDVIDGDLILTVDIEGCAGSLTLGRN